MTILLICVTIIIVGVIFSFKDNSRLIIDSEVIVSDNAPMIHITGKNTNLVIITLLYPELNIKTNILVNLQYMR